MMKTIYITLSLIFTICCTSCLKIFCKDDKLSIAKTTLPDNSLHLKGFYFGNKYIDYKGYVAHDVFVLYKSGALLYLGLYGVDQFDVITEIIKNNIQIVCDVKYDHGLVTIEDSTINLEYWIPSQCGYPTVLRTGTILNDTTFHLTSERESSKNYTIPIDQVFKFVEVDSVSECSNSFTD